MITDADLSIIIPLWSRTTNIERVYRSAREATPHCTIKFVVSDEDDDVWRALDRELHDETRNGLAQIEPVPGAGGDRGDYARKINTGYRESSTPLIFTAADDVMFYPGWFETAAAFIDIPDETITVLRGDGYSGLLTGPGKLPRIGVVGTNDLCNRRVIDGLHSTHSLVARWYADQGCCIDQDHVIYHEGYWHEYCDDELVQTAMRRGAYAHAGSAIVEHLHPLVGKADDDDTYRRGRERSRMSRRLFLERRRLWGGSHFDDATTVRRRIER